MTRRPFGSMIENQFPVLPQGASDFLLWLAAGTHRLPTRLVQELAGPGEVSEFAGMLPYEGKYQVMSGGGNVDRILVAILLGCGLSPLRTR